MTYTSYIFLKVFWIQTNTVNVMGKNMIWMNHRALILINLRVNNIIIVHRAIALKCNIRTPPPPNPTLIEDLPFVLAEKKYGLTPEEYGS